MSIEKYTLTNARGASVEIISLGAAITALRMPDRHGVLDDVVLACESPESYRDNPYYFGVVVGRYANRIAGGRFSLQGQDYQLAQNQGANHLHGGPEGFHRKVWSLEQRAPGAHSNSVALSCLSGDGEEGFPGNLKVGVTYTLTDANELVIDYLATTDQATIINLTQHSYFNLAGHNSGDILDHKLRVNAGYYTPVTENQIPTGEIATVDKTPMDLREFQSVRELISRPHKQLGIGRGLDHNFIIDPTASEPLHLAAEVLEPHSGRILKVLTDQPGVQVYSGNFIEDDTRGKDGASYGRHQGLCLETQHFPDSPNHHNFPSTTLLPGEVFASRTIYRFDSE